MRHAMGPRCHGPHGRPRWRPLTVDEERRMLEDYQRDLEQELADVVERLRRLDGKADGTPA
jgi:hypothetical protein